MQQQTITCDTTTTATSNLYSITLQSNLRRTVNGPFGTLVLTFSENVNDGSYRPPMGLAAARTAHLACRDVTMPALEMEILCCSIASWILVLSASFI